MIGKYMRKEEKVAEKKCTLERGTNMQVIIKAYWFRLTAYIVAGGLDCRKIISP
jgi:hypothetical protein